MTHRERARALLLRLLIDGPKGSTEILAAARSLGIHTSALYEDTGDIGVRRQTMAAPDGFSLWWLEGSASRLNTCA